MGKFTARLQGARGRKLPMLRSPETLQRCVDIALELNTGVLAQVARTLGCSAQTIRNWRNLSIESPREYMVMLPDGSQQPFHLALKMALQRGYVPAKRKPAPKRRGVIVRACDDPALKVAPNLTRPPGSGDDLRAARASPADRAARPKQATEQNPGPTNINSPATPSEPAKRFGSAPSGLKVGETAIIDGTLGKRMA